MYLMNNAIQAAAAAAIACITSSGDVKKARNVTWRSLAGCRRRVQASRSARRLSKYQHCSDEEQTQTLRTDS